MKIIDFHVHLREDDRSMDNYVGIMDRHHVEAVLCLGLPVEAHGCSATNENVVAAAKRHPGRVYAGPHIDMRRPVQQCVEDVERYADKGAVCIKLVPNLGFDPNDEHLEPIWRKVEERGLMCLSHCGIFLPYDRAGHLRVNSLTATPLHFEMPARRHPGINFIFAHFGGATAYLETIVMLARLPNCYADISPGWGHWIWRMRMPGLQDVDMSRVLFGTDTAGEKYGNRVRFWKKMLRGRRWWRRAVLRDFFYNNAARLLGLDMQNR